MDYGELKEKYGEGSSIESKVPVKPIVIVLAIAAVAVAAYYLWTSSPSLLNLNPDFNCPKSDWFVNLTNMGWRSNGYCMQSIRNRTGVALIHPVDERVPRYVEQEVDLRSAKKMATLDISLGNMAIVDSNSTNQCYDSLFVIKVTDIQTGKVDEIGQQVVNRNDGWVTYSYDLSPYIGKLITLRIENYAGGPCGIWNGEWGAVDYARVYA